MLQKLFWPWLLFYEKCTGKFCNDCETKLSIYTFWGQTSWQYVNKTPTADVINSCLLKITTLMFRFLRISPELAGTQSFFQGFVYFFISLFFPKLKKSISRKNCVNVIIKLFLFSFWNFFLEIKCLFQQTFIICTLYLCR